MFHARLEQLVADGVKVQVFFETLKYLPNGSDFEGQDYMRSLAEVGVHFEELEFKKDGWLRPLKACSLLLDVMFYANKDFDQADAYVERVVERLGRTYKRRQIKKLVRLFHWLCALLPGKVLRVLLRNAIKCFGFAAPKQMLALRQVNQFEGSTAYFAQYLELSARQPILVNFLKKRRRFKAVVLVPSWDNLTTKSVLKGRYDEVHVWGQFQQWEAMNFHLVRKSKINIAGNTSWPILSAEASEKFANIKGTQREKKRVLYMCSSKFIAPNEHDEIIELLKSRDDEDIANTTFHIWEHPQQLLNKSKFQSLESVQFDRPDNAHTQQVDGTLSTYIAMASFDIVVGKETSALAEAAMLGCKTFLYCTTGGLNPYHKTHLSDFIPPVKTFSDIHADCSIDLQAMRDHYGIIK